MADAKARNRAADDAASPPPGWRFRTGVALIIVGFLTPLGALVLRFTNLSVAMKATLGGALIAGVPEVFTVAAVALFGKSGFDYVKNRILALLHRYSPPREVGPVRYYSGLVIWLIPSVYATVLMYAPLDVIPVFPKFQIPVSLSMDFLFVLGFFIMGGEFWDKVRALFVHRARASFPDA